MAAAIQRASFAGSWYPGDAAELRAEVERLLGAERRGDRAVRALVVPHAGYRYSGKTAGAAYARVSPGRWKRAAILAPSHHHAFAGAAVYPDDGFETPLGVARVDVEGARRLTASAGFEGSPGPFRHEHAIEVQLPFLQVIDPSLVLVLVLLGVADDPAALEVLGSGLRSMDDGETLFVVSSDFTHYGADFGYLPFPPRGARSVAAELRRLDFGAIEPIRHGEAREFARYVERTGITICGRGPISAFLHLAAGRWSGEVVEYATSLDVTGDYRHSVSYAGLVFQPGAEART